MPATQFAERRCNLSIETHERVFMNKFDYFFSFFNGGVDAGLNVELSLVKRRLNHFFFNPENEPEATVEMTNNCLKNLQFGCQKG